MSPSPSTLFIATRKGLFRYEREAGSPWRIVHTAFVGDNVSMVLPCRDGKTVFAALNLGHFGIKLHRSTDSGHTYTEIDAPAYPKKPEGEIDLDPFRKTERKWNLDLIWSLDEGTPEQNGRLWCGTIPGGLFRSDDSGGSWTMMRSLWDQPIRKTNWFGGGYDAPGIHSVVVDPADGKHVLAAVSCGGVWRTRDDGETWEQTAHGMRAEYVSPENALDPDSQDPHLIAACAANPKSMWCQHHNGIFRSTDFGKSWTEIKTAHPSSFGFAVAAHPTDPDTAWFVPAQKDEHRVPVGAAVCVTRTTDGGKTFTELRDGLPQDHAYDLVFRHALALGSDGKTLVFGSTTGNLWASDSGGDRFETLATSLPPVACVRFGA